MSWVAVGRDEPVAIEEGGSYVLTVIPYVTYINETTPPVPGRWSRYNFVANVTPDVTTSAVPTKEDVTTMDYGKFTDSPKPLNQQVVSTAHSATKQPPSRGSTGLIVAVTIIAVFCLLAMVVLIVLMKRRGNEKTGVEQSYFRNNIEMKRKPDLVLEKREILHDQVTLEEKLGEGESGVVFKGVLVGQRSNPEGMTVAVKTTKDGASQELEEDLIDEMKLLAELGGHANILNLVACCSTSEPYYIITAFMEYGDLLGFLRKCRERKRKDNDPLYNVGELQQLAIGHDIADGMAHIQKLRYYHGDLAARNVLVGEGLSVKISDFGLADDIYTRGYKRRAAEQKIPIKWCSLETLVNGICSTQGDVWSFGVLLYDIFTLGGTPYPGISPVFMITQLKQGHRLRQPSSCPDDVYRLMRCCWQENPDSRPRFTDISQIVFEMKLKRENESESGESIGLRAGGGIRGSEESEDNSSENVYVNDSIGEDLAPINDNHNEINVGELQAALKDGTVQMDLGDT